MMALPSVMEMRPCREGVARVPRRRRSTSPASLAKAFWKFNCGEERMRTSRRIWLVGASGGVMVVAAAGLRGESGEIEVGTDREARDEHVAGEQEIVLRALQMQGCICQRADTLRIANTDALAGDREIGVNAVLVSEIAADGERAAAAHGGEGLDLEAVLVELQRTVQLAEAVGQIFKGERTVLESRRGPGDRDCGAGRELQPGRCWCLRR